MLAISSVLWPGVLAVILVAVIVGCLIKWAGFGLTVNKVLLGILIASFVFWLVLLVLVLTNLVVI